VLFNEPKLLKWWKIEEVPHQELGFSALQRAEIAETVLNLKPSTFAAVSVLFNEPKLLKLIL